MTQTKSYFLYYSVNTLLQILYDVVFLYNLNIFKRKTVYLYNFVNFVFFNDVKRQYLYIKQKHLVKSPSK